MKYPAVLAISVLVLMLASGCVQGPPSGQGQSPPPSGQGNTYNVNIQNLAFSPAALSINAGDTVIWTNNDNMQHTVTSDSGSELGSAALSKGQTYSHTFSAAGTFSYHCSIHTSMKASVTVV